VNFIEGCVIRTGYFDDLIDHLNRKKLKKGNGGISKPVITENDNILVIEYNYYYVTVIYDAENKMQRPLYSPYKLSIEKPCVITRGGSQDFGTAFSESWWATLDDVWLELQSKWKQTIR
jgi:hypothetical protein